jgi:uncharacterized protein YqhQ
MMRGSQIVAVAVRHPEGQIVVETEELNQALYQGPVSRIPFLRGLVSLWDALGLGTKALMLSADVAAGEETSFEGPIAWGTALFGIVLGVGLFMVLPSFLVGLLDPLVPSRWLSSLLEGVTRLIIVIAYIWGVGRLPDIQRVFAYHGAEHKTINAYEDGATLTVDQVQKYPTGHARCGTAFLLTLVVVSVLVLAPLSELPLHWRLLSRILLLPLIAGISYEYLRLTARFAHQPLIRAIVAPNLGLQKLTTNDPDDKMVEVAIKALKTVLAREDARASSGSPSAERPEDRQQGHDRHEEK